MEGVSSADERDWLFIYGDSEKLRFAGVGLRTIRYDAKDCPQPPIDLRAKAGEVAKMFVIWVSERLRVQSPEEWPKEWTLEKVPPHAPPRRQN